MEETSEKQIPKTEVKNPVEDEGGIRRRLRDRDMLRKRRAEAEEKATNQWVYGEQSISRKRVKQESNSTPGRKGRPRKNVDPPAEQAQPVQEEVQTEAPSDLAPAAPAVPQSEAAPSEKPPLAEALWAPAPVQTQTQVSEDEQNRKPEEGVLIEDLGPDEEEDKQPYQGNLVIDQGPSEEATTSVPTQNTVFAIPLFAPAAPQQEGAVKPSI